MGLKKITITGADDTINPGELLDLGKQFKFSEFGILVNDGYYGNIRFPSLQWIDDLDIVTIGNEDNLNLSLHVCGNNYVKKFLNGESCKFIDDLEDYIHSYKRIQLNTHNINHNFSVKFLKSLEILSNTGIEFIFQYDKANEKFVNEIVNSKDLNINCSVLFDKSGGNGILPDNWPDPLEKVNCGYAGGIGPDNISEQIEKILSKTGDIPFWIDMETKVRSNNDKQFDLELVYKCLEISKQYISND